MSNYSGWVKIHRKLLDSSFYKNSEALHLWVHLILSACHKEQNFLHGNQNIELKPGQILTGRKAISQKTGIQELKVKRLLDVFESEHQIEQQKTNKYTIISIVGWDDYQNNEQQNEQQMNNKRTTNEQQMNTYKNEKNDENEKNISPLSGEVSLNPLKKKSKSQVVYSVDYEVFWDAYQKKGSKRLGYAEWVKLTQDQKNHALLAIPPYFFDKSDRQYRKDVERYLKGAIWEAFVNLDGSFVGKESKNDSSSRGEQKTQWANNYENWEDGRLKEMFTDAQKMLIARRLSLPAAYWTDAMSQKEKDAYAEYKRRGLK